MTHQILIHTEKKRAREENDAAILFGILALLTWFAEMPILDAVGEIAIVWLMIATPGLILALVALRKARLARALGRKKRGTVIFTAVVLGVNGIWWAMIALLVVLEALMTPLGWGILVIAGITALVHHGRRSLKRNRKSTRLLA